MNSTPSTRNTIIDYTKTIFHTLDRVSPEGRCDIVRRLLVHANFLLSHYTKDKQEQSLLARITTLSDFSNTLRTLAHNLHLYVCPQDYPVRKMSAESTLQAVFTCLAEVTLEYNKKWSVLEALKAHPEFSTLTVDYKIKNAAFRVMDEEPFTSSVLQGDNFTRTFQRLKEDLIIFINLNQNTLSHETQRTLQRTLSKLEQLSNFAVAFDCITCEPNNPDIPHLISDTIFNIKLKLESLQPGDELLIPGGYINTLITPMGPFNHGHCVIYKITRTDLRLVQPKDRVYNFEIINRGEASVSTPSMLSTPVVLPDDICYNHILIDVPYDKLSSDYFWNCLIKANCIRDYVKSFKEIKQMLLICLDKETFTKGRFNKLQANGNCTYTSGTNWLEGELGELYPYFDLTMKSLSLGYLKSIQELFLTDVVVYEAVMKLTAHYRGASMQGLEVIQKLIECGEENYSNIYRQLAIADEMNAPNNSLHPFENPNESLPQNYLGISVEGEDEQENLRMLENVALGLLSSGFSHSSDQSQMRSAARKIGSSPTFEIINSPLPFSPKLGGIELSQDDENMAQHAGLNAKLNHLMNRTLSH